jgi:hypothetical protein
MVSLFVHIYVRSLAVKVYSDLTDAWKVTGWYVSLYHQIFLRLLPLACVLLLCVYMTHAHTTNTQHSDTGIPDLITTKEVISDAYSACQVLFSHLPCNTQKRTCTHTTHACTCNDAGAPERCPVHLTHTCIHPCVHSFFHARRFSCLCGMVCMLIL